VLLFLVFAFAAWTVYFRGSASLLRIEQARVERETRDIWTAPAMAQALRLLQTGTPPTDPYSCKLELTQDGVTKYFRLSYEQVSSTRWQVTAAPTASDDVAVEAPDTFAIPPSAVSGLVAVAATNTQIDLSWANVTSETGYSIERSANGTSGWTEISATGANVVSFSDTALSADTTYYYRVRAANAAGYGAYSAVASATTLPDIPAAPTDLTLTVLGSTSIRLNWTDNSPIESEFEIQRSPNGVGWTTVQSTGADATTWTDTGLNSNKTYYYRVRAGNSFGQSNWTSVENASTN
jgi:hypothetical protein